MIQTRHISRESLRLRLYLSSLALDVAALGLSFTLANLVVLGKLIQNGKLHGLILYAMIAPVYVLLAVHGGAYGIRMLNDARASMMRAGWALAQAAMLTLLIIYLGKSAETVSRIVFVAGFALSLICLALLRLAMAGIARRLFGEFPQLVALIVDGVPTPPLPGSFLIDAQALGLDPAQHDARSAAQLAAAVGAAEQVVVACSAERSADWSVALQSLSARGEVLLPELARFAPARLGQYGHYPTLIVAGGPLMFRDRILKRLFDLIGASLAIVALTPVFLIAALAVKLSSPGPIFFRQSRLGRDARAFSIFKFRTMRQDMADIHAEKLTERGDPRVTRVGAFLRRTSIDELPQLFNVINGDMSIVGPRPHAAAARAGDSLYWEVDDRYWARHCIKPGMTGLAQVRGHRGATNAHQDLIDRLQSDLEYVTDWSVWRDMAIIVATARVLVHDNAF